MDIIYVPDKDFKSYVKDKKARWQNVDGSVRWVVTQDDGMRYIVRPDSAKK